MSSQRTAHLLSWKAGRLGTFAYFDLSVVDVRQHLAEVPHVHERAADRAIAEMVKFGLSDAIAIVALHDLTFGFSPSSSHLRATSSPLSARHKNSAASWIEQPASIAALRSSISISVHSAPS
jgi:hypothetical protein